ncbi:HAD family hydrolase [Holdemania massiliensis]|uniref:HAD family hydrolase n=1 Tax=Holdemania massiliensis TaxID=1468449 RepID=UPI0035638785
MRILKTVVWDWNGTLLDDVEACIQTVNAMLHQRNLPLIESVDQYQSVFTFPVIDYYRQVGFDLNRERFEDLSEEYMAGYHARAAACGLFADVESGILTLKKHGIPSLILSASRQDHLRKQTEQCGCTAWFDDLIGISDIYAKEKLSAAQSWLQDHPQKDRKMIMVGDSLHDWEVAEALGWECILIDRGHQSRKRLESSGKPVMSNILEAVSLILA